MYMRVTAAQNRLGSSLNNAAVCFIDRCQTPVVEEVSLIAWVSGAYGETLHSCAVFSLAFISGKYFAQLVKISRYIDR